MTNPTSQLSSLRIAMVSPTLGTAFGLEQVLMMSVEGLRKRGHEIFLIGETANESLPKTETPALIPGLFSTPELIAPQQLKKVCREFEQTLHNLKPDLIHFLDQPPAEIIEFATRNYPCALTAHTVAPTCPASHRLATNDSVCGKKAGWSCLLHNKTLGCLNGFKT
ncbi:MAG: glycosyltransferase, partial [Deltaproteobacteria bacterium]